MNTSKQLISSTMRLNEIAIPILLVLLMNLSAVSKPRNRPRIDTKLNTIVTDEGTLLRGGTFWIYGWIKSKTEWALSDAPWDSMLTYGFNALRIACGYRPEHVDNYSLAEYDILLDTIINRAEKYGIYAIIDYHPEPGKYFRRDSLDVYENNRQHAIDFWTRFANRYKNKANVIFELINEPIFDGPNDYNDTLLNDFENLWKICDSIAPEVPIIVLTYCQVGGHPTQAADRAENNASKLEGIDWGKTAVGFHSYWKDSSDRMVKLKESYPCINTEFMCVDGSRGIRAIDGFDYHGTRMEQLKISWLQWDILDRVQSVEQKFPNVIQDLKKNGVFWPKDNAQKNITSSISKKHSIPKYAPANSRTKFLILNPKQDNAYKDHMYYHLNGRIMRSADVNHKVSAIIIK